jgi:hypothetical protein
MTGSADLDRRLVALKKKLAAIAARRSRRRFLPPFSTAELAGLEDALGAALPEDLRAFALTVTRGEEPTGFETLLLLDDAARLLGEPGLTARPFAFGDADAAAYLQRAAKRRRGADVEALDGPPDGLLPLRDHGCGEYDCVVLQGKQRGLVWKRWEAGLAPVFEVKKGEARPIDVLTWLERELADALRAAPPAIGPKAKEIDLSGQGVAEIPPAVFAALDAEKLDLSLNPLGTVPDAIGALVRLRALLLQDCALTALPTTVGSLAQLERLHLCNNQLVDLPDAFDALASLARLDLRDNQLQRLPPSLARLPALADLDLTRNRLAELPDLGALRSLQALKLAGNPLRRLPEGLGGTALAGLTLEDLPELDLAHALDTLAGIPSLRKLEIAIFRRELPSLRAFPGLTWLRLDGLLLGELPEEILSMQDLDYLSLARNQLTSLPDALFRLPRLRTLGLHGNPIDRAYVAALRARYPQVTLFA